MGFKPSIEKVIFNDPVTIVFWLDGTKTVVKCSKDNEFDPEKGLAMAISKKYLGIDFHSTFKKWLPKEEPVKLEHLTLETTQKIGELITKAVNDGLNKASNSGIGFTISGVDYGM